jgi:tetratricopeptide (TPR) repeat protein
MTGRRHYWVAGGLRCDRRAVLETLDLHPALTDPAVDAHRRLRGPYTMAGTVLRDVVPAVAAADPELVAAHAVEILSAAPELRALVPTARETLTSLAVPAERTRYYSRLRSRRLAHGLAEFLRDVTARSGPRTLIVENADHADETDVELLTVLLRRLDPALLTLVVCTGTPLAHAGLVEALDRYAQRHEPAGACAGHGEDADAKAYVDGDCVSDDPAMRAAYEALDPDDRRRLHDTRADDLQRAQELSPRLGAIPFHRERGTDPAGAGVAALRFAVDHCSVMGFYHATIDLAGRARRLVGWDQPELRYLFITSRLTTALAVLERPAEAEQLYQEARTHSVVPTIHMGAAYATGMLYTRHYEAERRDHGLARAWVNQAVAIASLLENPRERVFQSVFMRNGLALVEVHDKNLTEALRLVDDCIARMDAFFEPGEHRLHRSVLRYNRGQVNAGLGRLTDAVADYSAVIEADPNWPEYHFDRANLLRRLGRDDEALAGYETVMALSPAFHEAYYNRGDLRAARGDTDGALADFDYVLELDPDFLDAYVNRAALRLERGELDAALSDALAGLAREPDNPHLQVVLGTVRAERRDHRYALLAFDRAVRADPDLISARSGRAAVALELGDPGLAESDLEHAVALAPDDAVLRYNRAFVRQRIGQWARALADLDAAADLAPGDPDIEQARLRCRTRLAA